MSEWMLHYFLAKTPTDNLFSLFYWKYLIIVLSFWSFFFLITTEINTLILIICLLILVPYGFRFSNFITSKENSFCLWLIIFIKLQFILLYSNLKMGWFKLRRLVKTQNNFLSVADLFVTDKKEYWIKYKEYWNPTSP